MDRTFTDGFPRLQDMEQSSGFAQLRSLEPHQASVARIQPQNATEAGEIRFAGNGSEALTVTATEDGIAGMGGSDTIKGNNGDNFLVGDFCSVSFINGIYREEPGPYTYDFSQVGNDVLKGLGGADVMFADLGNDSLDGGSGDDIFVISVKDMGQDTFLGGSGFD